MNYSKLVKLNKRQFERQCKIEGQDIYNHTKGSSEKVIFVKTTNSRTSQDKTEIYFKAGSSIEKGDILKFKNSYYIVLNVNYPENEAWQSSLLIKCNTVWNLFGEDIPLVSSDLSSVNPSNGTVPTVGGTINLYTRDVELLHTKIGLNDVFYDFGGCYKLINKFFIDGIAFLYFQRETHADHGFAIKCANNNTNITKNTKAKFYLHALENGVNYYLPTAKIEYTSSNENVARVEDGIIKPLTTGSFNVTANCTYTFDYGDIVTDKNTVSFKYTQAFNITEISEDALNDKYLRLISTSGINTIILGYLRKLECVLFENDIKQESVPEMATLTYSIVNSNGSFVADAEPYITLGDKTNNDMFYITLGNGASLYLGNHLRVTATLSDGTSGHIDLLIANL